MYHIWNDPYHEDSLSLVTKVSCSTDQSPIWEPEWDPIWSPNQETILGKDSDASARSFIGGCVSIAVCVNIKQHTVDLR